MAHQRKSKGRQKFLALAPISSVDVPENIDRAQWLEEICKGFVSPSQANKSYYRVLLETLWPPNHGIPGPYVQQSQLRESIDSYRKSKHSGPAPYKPYVDVFRRLRELQGEEGIVGIGRQGETYQLVSLKKDPPRVPRIKLTEKDWEQILKSFSHKCAVCGRMEPEVRFQRDHKIPRTRGGNNELRNWQPLCDECNNFKSTSCRGCSLDCQRCGWAFPERFAPLRLTSDNIKKLRAYANRINVSPHALLNKVVSEFIQKNVENL